MYEIEIRIKGTINSWKLWDTLKNKPTEEYCKREFKIIQNIDSGYDKLRVFKVEKKFIKELYL